MNEVANAILAEFNGFLIKQCRVFQLLVCHSQLFFQVIHFMGRQKLVEDKPQQVIFILLCLNLAGAHLLGCRPYFVC